MTPVLQGSMKLELMQPSSRPPVLPRAEQPLSGQQLDAGVEVGVVRGDCVAPTKMMSKSPRGSAASHVVGDAAERIGDRAGRGPAGGGRIDAGDHDRVARRCGSRNNCVSEKPVVLVETRYGRLTEARSFSWTFLDEASGSAQDCMGWSARS